VTKENNGVSYGGFICIVVVFFSRTLSSKDYYSNGHGTMIPLEVIYEDKTVPQSSPKGNVNPEFIGDDEDDDNDIYKAQLLLFLKQSHLIRPNAYPNEQDNKSDTSDYSQKNSRKASAISTASEKNQEDNDEQAVDAESAQVPENLDTLKVSCFLKITVKVYVQIKSATKIVDNRGRVKGQGTAKV